MLNAPTTELTTAATDALLAAVCLALLPSLVALRAADQWRALLWTALFALVAAASVLGAVAHGFAMSAELRSWLWQPLYLMLGIVVALFVVGAVRDWVGEPAARRLVLPAIGVGVLFWMTSRLLGGNFIVFVIYSAVAMTASLVIYLSLAWRGSSSGAATIAAAIVLNLVAEVLQASSLQVTLVWPFDHNGLFHLVQIASMVLLQHGVRAGFLAPPTPPQVG